mmetsp:Transcript_3847/g.5694  ORF Transcript_3847/g.5694 Transcript_3847/m.5694 type:complete len:841 (+) Transcript_3847:19-2541(+)
MNAIKKTNDATKKKKKKTNSYDAAKDETTSPTNAIKELTRTNSAKSNHSQQSNESIPNERKSPPNLPLHLTKQLDDEEEEEHIDLYPANKKKMVVSNESIKNERNLPHHLTKQLKEEEIYPANKNKIDVSNEPSTTCPPPENQTSPDFIERAVRRHRSNSFKQSPLTYTPQPPIDENIARVSPPIKEKETQNLSIEPQEIPSPRSRTRSIVNASTTQHVAAAVEEDKENDDTSSNSSEESVHKTLRNFMETNRMGETIINYNELHRTSYLRQIPTAIDGVEGIDLGEGNVAARRKLGMVGKQPYHQVYHSNAVRVNIPTNVEDPAKYLNPEYVVEEDSLRPPEEKLDYIKTQIISWNMNGYSISKRETQALIRFVIPGTQHIYVFGTQECMRTVTKSLFIQPKPEWEDFLSSLLGMEYVPLASSTLVGSHLIVFIRRSLLPFVSALHTHEVPCGFLNEVGNRGATSISFRVGKTKFAFINVHLTSKQKHTERRHRNLQKIIDQVQYYIDVDGHGKHIYLPSSSRTGVFEGMDYSTKHRELIAQEEPEKGKPSRTGSILHLKKSAKNRLLFEPYDLSLKPSPVVEEEPADTLNKLTSQESFKLDTDDELKKPRRRSSLFNVDSIKSLGSQISSFGRNITLQNSDSDDDFYDDEELIKPKEEEIDRLLQQKDKSSETTLLLKNGNIFEDMDHVVFLGDFNYRINGNLEIVEKCIEENELDIMLQNDQLNRSRMDKQLPGHRHLYEGRILFNPTYCFVPHRNVYNNNAQRREIPSWPSRILFSKHADAILLEYDSCYQFRYSQHRPVHSRMLMHVDFDIKTDKFDSKHRVKPYTSSTSVCTIS